jgi:hypothetical protein
MSQNRNTQNFALSYDQRLLLELYIDFYNNTIRQMDSLQELQNEIRGNINQIVGLTARNYARNNSNQTNNSNTHGRNSRQNNQNSRQFPWLGRQNYFEPINRRYMYHGNIPRVVPSDVPYAHWRGQTIGRATENENEQDNTFLNNLLRTFYDRIQVAPNRRQIENATRITAFSEIENPINNSCPVTLDRFENNSSVTQIIPCGHIFSPSGIDSWLQSNVRCPVCRYDIRDYNSNAQTSSEPIIQQAPGEETKDEGPLEESKNDSDETTQERNSFPNRTNNINRTTFTSSDIQNTLSSITENILGQILNPTSNSSGTSINYVFDTSFNSLVYDASNNQFIFEGLLRR